VRGSPNPDGLRTCNGRGEPRRQIQDCRLIEVGGNDERRAADFGQTTDGGWVASARRMPIATATSTIAITANVVSAPENLLT
jgi:hypothetical protein